MSEIVDSTNVLVLNAELGPPADPKQCLQMLVNLGGNVKAFAEKFSADASDQCRVLFQARRIMEDEPYLLQSWDNAIRDYQQNYLLLLQCDALDTLDLALQENSVKERAAVAKGLLSALLAAQVVQAKLKATSTESDAGGDGEEDYNADDEALAAAEAK